MLFVRAARTASTGLPSSLGSSQTQIAMRVPAGMDPGWNMTRTLTIASSSPAVVYACSQQ